MNNYTEDNYLITDGKNYIRLNCQGKYEVVSNFALADFFPKNKALSVLNHSIKKSLKSTFYVAIYTNDKIIPLLASENTVRDGEMKVVAKWMNDYSDEDKKNISRWLNAISGLKNVVSEAMEREEEIEPAIHTLDTIYSELDHYTESKKVNAAKGYCLESIRHRIRNKRRALKIEKQIVQSIVRFLDDNNNKKLAKALETIENKAYAPQILTELFENDDLDSVKRMVESVV